MTFLHISLPESIFTAIAVCFIIIIIIVFTYTIYHIVLAW